MAMKFPDTLYHLSDLRPSWVTCFFAVGMHL